jgi:hypothetical protein
VPESVRTILYPGLTDLPAFNPDDEWGNLLAAAADDYAHDVDNTEAGVTRTCSVNFVPALSLKLVARRHVDYGRTRSMICMPV